MSALYCPTTTFFSLMYDAYEDPSLFSNVRKTKLAYCRIITLGAPWAGAPMRKIGLRVHAVRGKAIGTRQITFDIVLRGELCTHTSFVVDECTDDIFEAVKEPGSERGGAREGETVTGTGGEGGEARHACG